MIKFHLDGNLVYMVPLSLMLLANLGLLTIAVYRKYATNTDSVKLQHAIHHVSMLALVWGMLGTIIALFHAFGSLSEIEEVLPFQIIMGGLKVAMITAIYGMIIFVISFAGLLFLKSGKSIKL
jgi:hypothetical protein